MPRLSQLEAIDLCSAFVDSVARRSGARQLLIKGVVANQQLLRPARVPADVDALVHPNDYTLMRGALAKRGWREMAEPAKSHVFAGHSATLVHDFWPCTIDLHQNFPGFLGPPAGVFEALWARRTVLSIAHTDVLATDPLGSRLVIALHALRAGRFGREDAELEHLATIVLTEPERTAIAELAVLTGCAETLGPQLSAWGVDPWMPPHAPEDPRLVREWRLLTRFGFTPGNVWVSQFWIAPLWQRPAVVKGALWPSESDLRAAHPELESTSRAFRRARWGRLFVGARQIAATVRARFWSRRVP